jgi:MFS family permease
MTGTVFYWSSVYNNPDVLLWMTSIYSSPSFFIQLAQARFDFKFNMEYGIMVAMRFRMVLLLSLLSIIAACIPFLPPVLPLFLIICFILGVCSSACYGTLFQLVALYPRNATGFLSLGYAAPGVFLLFISRGIFGTVPRGANTEKENLYKFFGIVVCMVFLALIAINCLLYFSKKQLMETAASVPTSVNQEISTKAKKKIKPNNAKILRVMWRSSIGIALLMISRLTVFTILLRVPSGSSDPDEHKAFSQTLVYINLSGDLIGRFFTVVLPKLPVKIAPTILLVGIIIHFMSVNLVLLYVFSGAIPISDVAAQAFFGHIRVLYRIFPNAELYLCSSWNTRRI